MTSGAAAAGGRGPHRRPVNNAGYGSYGALEDADRRGEASVRGQRLRPGVRLSQLVLPSMRRRPRPHRQHQLGWAGAVAGRRWAAGTTRPNIRWRVLSDAMRVEVAPSACRWSSCSRAASRASGRAPPRPRCAPGGALGVPRAHRAIRRAARGTTAAPPSPEVVVDAVMKGLNAAACAAATRDAGRRAHRHRPALAAARCRLGVADDLSVRAFAKRVAKAGAGRLRVDDAKPSERRLLRRPLAPSTRTFPSRGLAGIDFAAAPPSDEGDGPGVTARIAISKTDSGLSDWAGWDLQPPHADLSSRRTCGLKQSVTSP